MAHMLMAETVVMESGIGNCGEQAGIVYLFLCRKPYAPKFCLANLGRNHQFVIIGVDEEEVNNVWPDRLFLLDVAPNWPDAVICDSWHRKSFAVKTGWATEIPAILRKTEPQNTEPLVKLEAIFSTVWKRNPIYR